MLTDAFFTPMPLVRTLMMMLIRAKTTFTWKCCFLSSVLLSEDISECYETASAFLVVIDRFYSGCLLNLPILFVLDRRRVATEVTFPEYDSAKEDNKHHCQILLSSSLTVFLSKDSACTQLLLCPHHNIQDRTLNYDVGAV